MDQNLTYSYLEDLFLAFDEQSFYLFFFMTRSGVVNMLKNLVQTFDEKNVLPHVRMMVDGLYRVRVRYG